LYVPGVIPGPPPQWPSEKSSSQQKLEYEKWKVDWDEWSKITCPCGWGYFNYNGIWVSGAKVRKGNEPSNPLWKDTGGQAPTTKDTGRAKPSSIKFEAFPGKLFERLEDTAGSSYVTDIPEILTLCADS
jgi:hypothetical protein